MSDRCADCHCEFGPELPRTRHHLHYKHEEMDWVPEETVDLCWECHYARHRANPNKEYWRDCDQMEAYWYTYYKEMEKE